MFCRDFSKAWRVFTRAVMIEIGTLFAIPSLGGGDANTKVILIPHCSNRNSLIISVAAWHRPASLFEIHKEDGFS